MRERMGTAAALPYLAPALVVVGLVVLLPLVATVGLSFTDAARGSAGHFAGLAQYAKLAGDAGFWRALVFTTLFAVGTVAVEVALGLAVAGALVPAFRGRGWVRVLLLLPWALPTVVAGRIWEWLFHYQYGVFNLLLAGAFGEGARVDWLGSIPTVYFSLGIADIWKTTPYVIILALAALLTLDGEVMAAARLDGARGGFIVRKVVLPLIAPALLIVAAFRLVDAFRVFDLIYVLTGGGPGGSTVSVSLYAYQQLFAVGDFAYAAAVATASFAIFLLLALAYVVVYQRSRAFRGGVL